VRNVANDVEKRIALKRIRNIQILLHLAEIIFFIDNAYIENIIYDNANIISQWHHCGQPGQRTNTFGFPAGTRLSAGWLTIPSWPVHEPGRK
jgi:hypothetical protein